MISPGWRARRGRDDNSANGEKMYRRVVADCDRVIAPVPEAAETDGQAPADRVTRLDGQHRASGGRDDPSGNAEKEPCDSRPSVGPENHEVESPRFATRQLLGRLPSQSDCRRGRRLPGSPGLRSAAAANRLARVERSHVRGRRIGADGPIGARTCRMSGRPGALAMVSAVAKAFPEASRSRMRGECGVRGHWRNLSQMSSDGEVCNRRRHAAIFRKRAWCGVC